MKLIRTVSLLILLSQSPSAWTQYISEAAQETLKKIEWLQLQNKPKEALSTLNEAIDATNSPDDLAHLYTHQSGLYASLDSLLAAKKALDLSFENAEKTSKKTSLAAAYRAKAYLNNLLNLPDEVVK